MTKNSAQRADAGNNNSVEIAAGAEHAKGAVPAKGQSRIASSHLNFMAGESFDIHNPIVRLRSMAASSFFGEPQYYRLATDKPAKPRNPYASLSRTNLDEKQLNHLVSVLNGADPREWRALTPAKAMEKAIDAALDHDLEAALQVAVELRSQDNIRTTPQVIAVRAANHKAAKGTGLIRRYAAAVIQRADEAAVQMEYQLATFGRPVPAGLKRAWSDALGRQSQFQIAKWRGGAKATTLNDVVSMTHAKSDSLDLLMKDQLKLGEDGNETWESIRSSGGSWEQAVAVMGHMALLRNLRNLIDNSVDPDLWLEKFVAGAPTGRQLPFRYVSAHQAVLDAHGVPAKNKNSSVARILAGVEQALDLSIGNLPTLPGRSLVLTDNSGSAQGTATSSMGTMKVATIGNLMGILTARASEKGGKLGVFGDQVAFMDVSPTDPSLDQVKKAEALVKSRITGGTEHGIWEALDLITTKNEVYDNVFVYSDMQAGHGGLYGTGKGYVGIASWPGSSRSNPHIDVPALVKRYREKVNPKVMVFLVQIAGYEDTLIPEFYDRTFILGGWSDGILRFARKMIDLHEGK